MRILVTAGSTWAKIDSVRVLANRFTGGTGLYLAKKLAKKGHHVTLIANPHLVSKFEGLRVLYFHYFDQFKEIIEEELKNVCYDAIIHSAAVSDYLPKRKRKGKIPSGKKKLVIDLMPAPKIIRIIRKLAKKSLLIQFKLEEKKEGIIDKAYKSLKENGSDYVVANALEELKEGYKAVLINSDKFTVRIDSKRSLADQIDTLLTLRGCK